MKWCIKYFCKKCKKYVDTQDVEFDGHFKYENRGKSFCDGELKRVPKKGTNEPKKVA